MTKQTLIYDNEIWKDIKDFEGLYRISNLGRIYSVTTNKIRQIQVNNHRYGYCEISLHKNGKEYRFKVHRLVALHFIPNPLNKPEVNHKDGNKLNNCYHNLEWVTSVENKQHAWKNSLYTSKHRQRPIICNETGEEFPSVVEASRKLNIDRRSLFRVLKGERKTCNKLSFRYKEELNNE